MNIRTHVGRSLDVNYKPNLYILLLVASSVPIAFTFLIKSNDFLFSIGNSVIIGISIFLAWAISREIDPDNDIAAFMPLPLFILGASVHGLPSVLAMLVILITLRMINRTVGVAFEAIDISISLSLSAFASYYLENVLMVPIISSAILIDALMDKRYKNLIFFLISVAIIAMMVIFFDIGLALEKLAVEDYALVVLATTIYIPLVHRSRSVNSIGDLTGISLEPTRVMACQLFFLIMIIALTFFQGMEKTYPYWSILLGLSIYNIFHHVDERGIKQP